MPGFRTTTNLEISLRKTNREHAARVAADTPITRGPRDEKSPSIVAIAYAKVRFVRLRSSSDVFWLNYEVTELAIAGVEE
jgi:hypothetical protein